MDINQYYQELSQTNHSLPNKLTKTYISFHGEQCIWEKLFLTNAYDTKCMQSKIQGCLYMMLHMPCQIQDMHKGNYTYATKELPHTKLKKSNTHQAPPANEWKLLNLGVWWKYRLVGQVWVHGSKLSLCLVLEWSTGFFATLMALVLSHSPHQSHSWCMWSKGAESNN
jgi:hypothetical protein